MCTRGRLSNHVYLQLVGDGDPHTLIRPDTIRPHRHGAARTHPGPRRHAKIGQHYCENSRFAVWLRDAIERYTDALHVAAEHVVGKSAAQALRACEPVGARANR